jgi:small subunit ribosomal protein S6e
LANFKLTISDKSGKSVSKELKDKEASGFIGLHLGNEIDAAIAGLAGKLKLTGGSDKSGIPMRADIYGSARKPVLISKGVGLKKVEKGQRRRRLIRGNVISEEIYQLNCSYDGELKVEEAPPAEVKA